MTILNQNKVRLVNYETSTRNPDSSTMIYLTTDKVSQRRLVSDNRREKGKVKNKKTTKKTSTRKFHLQQK